MTPRYRIETEENVHGVYHVEARDEQHARDLFDQGSVQPPEVFESISVEGMKVTEEADV